MNGRARVVALKIALSLVGAAIGLSQGATAQDKPSAGLADIMTTAQMRHIKLWFAGKLGNWRLAGYQLDQAMPNPRLAQYQIDEIIALFDTLRVGGQ